MNASRFAETVHNRVKQRRQFSKAGSGTIWPVIASVSIVLVLCGETHAGTAQRVDDHWHFTLADPADAWRPSFDDSGWRVVDVPHDWSIESDYSETNTPQNSWLPGGVGWYRRVIDLPETVRDKKVLLRFDGVYMNSKVWLNGHEVGGRPYGFMTFYCDLTQCAKAGQNTLALRVDNTPVPTARFYHGSGIYGHVDLLFLPRVHFVPNGGVFVRTLELNGSHAELAIDVELVDEGDSAVDVVVRHRVLNAKRTCVAESDAQSMTISTNAIRSTTHRVRLENVTPWSIKRPYLYQLESVIERDGHIIDTRRTHFGVRTMAFKADTGFWLNGENVKLKGVCEHLELGPMGLSIPDELMVWRLKTLKSMGCNAIRTAHNPATPMFYDVCDRLGLLVMDEIFDGWHRKNANDYGERFFADWWRRDVTDWVRRDRNHPSVILYSIGNETGHSDEHDISGLIHSLDSTRPTTGGAVFDGVDVSGFNGDAGKPGFLEAFHKEHPDRPVVLTEVPHTIQTRGFYRIPTWWRDAFRKNRPVHQFTPYGTKQIFFGGHERYRSSYDNCAVRINARTCWKRTRDTAWISGEFRWTGFDCFGEAQFMGAEFPKRIYNAGVIDLAGFPKDHFYFYQSQWTDRPMVHLLPHWTHPNLERGTTIPVVAYSNCDEVELWLNDQSLGRQSPSDLLDFVWKVPWQPGQLKAVGYRQDKPVVETTIRTAGPPVRLTLDVSNATDTESTIKLLSVSAVDAKGTLVPWSMNRVDFQVAGDVKLLGYENGNPVDGTAHHADWRNLFYGLARGFYQLKRDSGPVNVTAAAILGERRFRQTTSVALACRTIGLNGQTNPDHLVIRYTTDGSVPTVSSPEYREPFIIDKTTTIHAIVTRGDQVVLETQSTFEKGPRPHITDPRWEASSSTQKTPAKEPFAGPFDQELVGKWREGNRLFLFNKDGTVQRQDKSGPTHIGWWWYDYPTDVFENPTDAGNGELRWKNSGDVSRLRLTNQQATSLEIKTGKRKRVFLKATP